MNWSRRVRVNEEFDWFCFCFIFIFRSGSRNQWKNKKIPLVVTQATAQGGHPLPLSPSALMTSRHNKCSSLWRHVLLEWSEVRRREKLWPQAKSLKSLWRLSHFYDFAIDTSKPHLKYYSEIVLIFHLKATDSCGLDRCNKLWVPVSAL